MGEGFLTPKPLDHPNTPREDVSVFQEHTGWALSWPLGKSSLELPKELWETVGKTSPSSLWPLSDSDQMPTSGPGTPCSRCGVDETFLQGYPPAPAYRQQHPCPPPHPTYDHWPAFAVCVQHLQIPWCLKSPPQKGDGSILIPKAVSSQYHLRVTIQVDSYPRVSKELG